MFCVCIGRHHENAKIHSKHRETLVIFRIDRNDVIFTFHSNDTLRHETST